MLGRFSVHTSGEGCQFAVGADVAVVQRPTRSSGEAPRQRGEIVAASR
jgi:hypothetical protein